MAKLDLTQYGITGSTVIAHNPSYEYLFAEETKAGLEGFDKGVNTELNAVNVMTGIYTGRSPYLSEPRYRFGISKRQEHPLSAKDSMREFPQ